MGEVAEKTKQENQQDIGINELNQVESILNSPQNAEKLTNNFGSKLEEELTKLDGGIDNIKKIKNTLTPLLEKINNTENKETTDPDDKQGLEALDKFLNDCLLNNEQVQAANQTITQMLNKLDNRGEGRKINIDEKKIALDSARIDGNNVNLEYNLDEKNTIVISIGGEGINIVDGAITIPDKDGKDQYFKIAQDDKGGLKLEKDADGLLNKLASYAVTGNAERKKGDKVTKQDGKYKVNMISNINKESLISFVLDENGGIGLDNTREQGDYKITINQKDNTFNIKDLKADEKKDKIEALKRQEENKEIAELDFNTIVKNKIEKLGKEETDEANKKTPEGYKKAGDIQKQIESLEDMKKNYEKISEKTTAIENQILEKTTAINIAEQSRKYDDAANLASEKKDLESEKSKIQELEGNMKKQASEDKWDKVSETWVEIDALINPPQAATAVGEAATASTETAATGLTEKSVIDSITDNELKPWYEKTDSRNQLKAIIDLLPIKEGDSDDIKTKKTDLAKLLADGNMVGFQEEVGIKKNEEWNDGAPRLDGKLGPYTLKKAEEVLKGESVTVQSTTDKKTEELVDLNIVTNGEGAEDEKDTQLDQKIIDDLAQETKRLGPSEGQGPADVLPSEKRNNLNEKQKQTVIEKYDNIKNIKEESENKVLNYQDIDNDIQKIIAGIDSQNSGLGLTFDRASLMNDRYIKKNDPKIDAMILFYSLKGVGTAEEIIDKVMEKNRINDLGNDYLKSIYAEFNKISPEKNLIDYIKSDYLNYRSSNTDRSKGQTYINKFQIANK